MKTIPKLVGVGLGLFSLAAIRAPEAQAFRGRGAAFVVGAAAGNAHGSSKAEAEQQAANEQQQAAQQQAAAAAQQAAYERGRAEAQQQAAAAAMQEAATAKPRAAAPGALPLGTVVGSLPKGCTAVASVGVNYYRCGVDYYQAVFEGSVLKYVTTTPK